MMKNIYGKRLLVVSNRLPVVIEKKEGAWFSQRGTGGLVTALSPVMEENRGLWIGWLGSEGELLLSEGEDVLNKLLRGFKQKHAYGLKPVWLPAEEMDKYYHGFSNETLWPLFHDLIGHCKFEQDNWEAYVSANQRFAKAVVQEATADDFIWIHDYQLMLVGQYLRQMNLSYPLAYFLHIPFPSLDLFRRLPWKHEIIRALMEYDMLGFQTLRDRRNFVQCAKGLLPNLEISIKRRQTLLKYGKRLVKVGNFPIGVDFAAFDRAARSKEVAEAAWYLHENLKIKQLIIGLDRLDYTKGIPERFRAFERALEKYPELQGKVSLIQVLIPSRTDVADYQSLKEILDGLTGRINGRFSKSGWIPIHYMYRRLDRVQLIGHYKACEIALVTPLRDGMNLVAKEYCASSVDNNGVLILSEFAGAVESLSKGALVVNPYDLEGTADAIYEAVQMPAQERKRRMSLMRTIIKRNNVHRWVEWFLESFSAPQNGSYDNGRPSGITEQAGADYDAIPYDMPEQDMSQEMTNIRLWIAQTRASGKHPPLSYDGILGQESEDKKPLPKGTD